MTHSRFRVRVGESFARDPFLSLLVLVEAFERDDKRLPAPAAYAHARAQPGPQFQRPRTQVLRRKFVRFLLFFHAFLLQKVPVRALFCVIFCGTGTANFQCWGYPPSKSGGHKNCSLSARWVVGRHRFYHPIPIILNNLLTSLTFPSS